MRHWHRLHQLIRTLFRARRVDRDLDDEARDWLETLTERHQAHGLTPDAARRAAALELGGVEQMKDAAREMRNGSQIESSAGDLRYAWRALRRAPGFTAAVVLTFGLGIGANTAIFSVVKAVLIEPFPYADAGRLMLVWSDLTDMGYPHAPLAGPELAEFQRSAASFERFGGVWATNATLGGDGDPEQLRIATVTADFFAVLGVSASLGRVIGPDDFGPLPIRPVLLSHALWARRFGSDPAIVGRQIVLNDRPASVVGVMGPTFRLLFPPDAAVPEDLQAWVPGGPRPGAEPRGQQYLRVVGRMKPGVSVASAIQEVSAVGAAIVASAPGNYTPGWRFYAVPMQEDSVRPIRPALLAIFAGVGMLLAIACVNVAGLLIVRAASRRKETMMRVAIGASRGRLVRQYLIEGLLLSVIGGLTGVLFARASLAVLLALAPASLGRIHGADLDAGVLLFAGAIALLWGVVFSLMPLSEVWRVDLSAVLQHEARGSAGPPRPRLRSLLVVGQVALGLMLLVGAALLARTFVRLLRLDPGFVSAGVVTFRVAPPFSRYQPMDGYNAFNRRMTEALAALPGVTGVGTISHVPYDNLPNWATPYIREDETDATKAGLADSRTVSPGFFEAIGARLIAGRFFAEPDVPGEGVPTVIDDAMATRLFGDSNPIGRAFRSDLGGSGQMALMRVIGVVAHLRHRSLTEYGREQMFVSARVVPRNHLAYAVRTTGDLNGLAGRVRGLVKELDPRLPVYDVRPLGDYVSAARAPQQFTTALAGLFAAVALALACVGVYGVVAYGVARRRREFGVRLALGARPSQIIWLVLRDGAALTTAGLAIGLAGAAGAARLLGGQLFEVRASDPAAFAMGFLVLAAAALLACWLPARRAGRATPLAVLHED